MNKLETLKSEFKALASVVDERELTDDEQEKFDNLASEIETEKANFEKAQKNREIAAKINQMKFDAPAVIQPAKSHKYNILKAIAEEHLTGFEREVQQELEQEFGSCKNGNFYLPSATYDLSATTAASLVRNTVSDKYLESVKAKTVLGQLGVNFFTNLTPGKVAIPSLGGGSAYWVAAGASETTATNLSLQFTPWGLGAYVDIERSCLAQTSEAIQKFVEMELLSAQGVAIQTSLFHGAGTTQPTGLAAAIAAYNSASNLVVMGDNGLSPTYLKCIEALGIVVGVASNIQWTTSGTGLAKLMSVARVASTDSQFISDGKTLAGYPIHATTSVSNVLDKGTSEDTCTALFCGDWSRAYVGMWGQPELLIDRTTGGTTGIRRVIVLQDCDVQYQTAAFSAIVDILD